MLACFRLFSYGFRLVFGRFQGLYFCEGGLVHKLPPQSDAQAQDACGFVEVEQL